MTLPIAAFGTKLQAELKTNEGGSWSETGY
jgi:hypothetical protein